MSLDSGLGLVFILLCDAFTRVRIPPDGGGFIQKRHAVTGLFWLRKHEKTPEFRGFFGLVSFCTSPLGGPEETRTLDLSDANRTLSQLSYRPMYAVFSRKQHIYFSTRKLGCKAFLRVFCGFLGVLEQVDVHPFAPVQADHKDQTPGAEFGGHSQPHADESHSAGQQQG